MGAEKRILRTLGFGLVLWLTVLSVYPQQRAAEMEDPSKTVTMQKLSAAESTYEVIVGYIKREAYDKAFSMAKTLFDLKLPAKYDTPMIEAIGKIAEKFAEKKQFDMAQAILDEAIKQLGDRDDNDIKLLKIKAFIYKEEGNGDKALEIFEKALGLERKRLNK